MLDGCPSLPDCTGLQELLHLLEIYIRIFAKRMKLTLTLFVLRVVTNHHDAAFALGDFAFFTDRFNRRSYFHLKYLLKVPRLSTGEQQVYVYLERQVMRPLLKS